MSIEELIKKKDEYMILGIGWKNGVFFFSFGRPSLSFSLLFYLIVNPNPYFPKNIVIS
jgi:hypothetical protein